MTEENQIFTREYHLQLRNYGVNSHSHKEQILILAAKCAILEKRLIKLENDQEKEE